MGTTGSLSRAESRTLRSFHPSLSFSVPPTDTSSLQPHPTTCDGSQHAYEYCRTCSPTHAHREGALPSGRARKGLEFIGSWCEDCCRSCAFQECQQAREAELGEDPMESMFRSHLPPSLYPYPRLPTYYSCNDYLCLDPTQLAWKNPKLRLSDPRRSSPADSVVSRLSHPTPTTTNPAHNYVCSTFCLYGTEECRSFCEFAEQWKRGQRRGGEKRWLTSGLCFALQARTYATGPTVPPPSKSPFSSKTP